MLVPLSWASGFLQISCRTCMMSMIASRIWQRRLYTVTQLPVSTRIKFKDSKIEKMLSSFQWISKFCSTARLANMEKCLNSSWLKSVPKYKNTHTCPRKLSSFWATSESSVTRAKLKFSATGRVSARQEDQRMLEKQNPLEWYLITFNLI